MMLGPDDFLDDPYGHVVNQAGHAAMVGMPLAVPLLALGWPLWLVPLIVFAAYGIIWECIVQPTLGEFNWRDSLMDSVCVMAGASIVCGFRSDLWTGAICLVAWMVVVLFGGLRRWK